MKSLSARWTAIAVAITLTGSALAQGHDAGHGAHGEQPSHHGAMDMHAMMKKNDEAMAAMPSTGDVDVDFAMMMKVHHQGAIDMAQHQLRHGKDATMKAMAREIIAAQKKEIAAFDAFLAGRGHGTKK
ncbi:MAG TPA: DUF305 domain-containing protein [Ramlibacter sp.]|uniref:DUF305 domain-containing protein n=1 Tax=Ramlibacter sp. TaxID=1917967 RepID=UPI002D6189C9|nr:DUF305 domain-containing protein [Ramlibacter sp.]HZY19212.1 DUF305 domain-containing protein [Ramlibacter sp.]